MPWRHYGFSGADRLFRFERQQDGDEGDLRNSGSNDKIDK